jgi:hypothetical protein
MVSKKIRQMTLSEKSNPDIGKAFDVFDYELDYGTGRIEVHKWGVGPITEGEFLEEADNFISYEFHTGMLPDNFQLSVSESKGGAYFPRNQQTGVVHSSRFGYIRQFGIPAPAAPENPIKQKLCKWSFSTLIGYENRAQFSDEEIKRKIRAKLARHPSGQWPMCSQTQKTIDIEWRGFRTDKMTPVEYIDTPDSPGNHDVHYLAGFIECPNCGGKK